MKLKGRLVTIVAGLMGLMIFILIFGPRVLLPVFTDFLTEGDPGQHYYGWLLFREAPWQPMIGMMNTADHPYSVSVIFTDSIPLCAVFFKLFRAFLPKTFQYFGLWGLFCFVMQGVLSERILARYVKNPALRLVDTSFLLFLPIFVRRVFWHTAVSSHWIILVALYLFLSDADSEQCISEKKRTLKIALRWGITGILCASVHIYLLGICAFIMIFSALRVWYEQRGVLRALLIPVSFLSLSAFTLWILGGFSSGMSSGAPGLGYYSFNLLGFFIPDRWSSFMPEISYYTEGQIEGFSYLGIGLIFLVFIALCTGVRRKIWRRPVVGFGIGLFVFSLLFSLSTEVSAGQYLLWKYDIESAGLIRRLWEVFRSTGRFVWIPTYLLVFGAFAVLGCENLLNTRIRPKKAIMVLTVCCLVLQIVDLYPGLSEKSRSIRDAQPAMEVLNAPIWDELAESGKYRHIIFMNKDLLMQNELYAFANYAAMNHMTINDFDFARSFDLHIREIAEDSARHSSSDTIYIFTMAEQNMLDNFDLTYYAYDGYFIGLKERKDE